MKDAPSNGLTHALERNITALSDRRREEQARAPRSVHLANAITRFSGTLSFVAVHLVLIGFWVAANLGVVPGVPRFDPSFVILATAASVEAIFLSTFVLISQNRMQAEADRRADLDLHISLLTEHELTSLARLVARIAERLDIDTSQSEDVREIGRDVVPERVLDEIDARKAG